MLAEYRLGVQDKLRALELESIQDYIAESDNLVALHTQVGPVGGKLASGKAGCARQTRRERPVAAGMLLAAVAAHSCTRSCHPTQHHTDTHPAPTPTTPTTAADPGV